LKLSAVAAACGYVGNALALSTYPQAFARHGIAVRIEQHNSVVITAGLAGTTPT
jgi:hypothetical protein